MRHDLILAGALLAAAAAPLAAAASPRGDFDRAAARTCPAEKLDQAAPAALLEAADAFRASLGPSARRRVDLRLGKQGDEGAIAVCRGRDGAACDVGAYMAAYRKLDLTTRFAAAACRSRAGR